MIALQENTNAKLENILSKFDDKYEPCINPPNVQDEISRKIPLKSEPSPDLISTFNLTESDSSIIQSMITMLLNEQTMQCSKLHHNLNHNLMKRKYHVIYHMNQQLLMNCWSNRRSR